MEDVLRGEGYEVSTADDGVAAMAEIQRSEPFVVVTDWNMPNLNGEQFLARAQARDRRLPVVVLSGQRPKASRFLGAFRVIDKSMPLEEILSAIAEAAAHHVSHLPLEKLWRAAGAGGPARPSAGPAAESGARGALRRLRRLVSSSLSWIWSGAPRRILVVGILVASSAALIRQVARD